MTTPIDPDTRIAELENGQEVAWKNRYLASLYNVTTAALRLASELAEKLSSARRNADDAALYSSRYMALVNACRNAPTSVCFCGCHVSFVDDPDKDEAESRKLATVRALADHFVAHAETKRELEQERVRLAGCGVAALGWNDNPAKPGDYGYSASYGDVLRVRAVVDAVLEREKQLSACVLGCPWDEHPRRHRDDCPLVVHGFRETHVPQPPLPACKRCGKPVAHPAQEYCGAACSVERGRAVEQRIVTDEPAPGLTCECAAQEGCRLAPHHGDCGREPARHFMLEGWLDSLVLCEGCSANCRELAEGGKGERLAVRLFAAQRIDAKSWLSGPRYEWFRRCHSYASSKTNAIEGLAKIHPTELYHVVGFFFRELGMDDLISDWENGRKPLPVATYDQGSGRKARESAEREAMGMELEQDWEASE